MRKTLIQCLDFCLDWKPWQVIVLILCLLLVTQTSAEELRGDSMRVIWVNDSTCPSHTRPVMREALRMWSFYGHPDLYEAENTTTAENEQDWKNVIYCKPDADAREELNGSIAATYTYTKRSEGRIYEADILILDAWVQTCVMLHELGHLLGLALAAPGEDHAHPDDPTAVMYYKVSCAQNFLTVTDLTLIAKAYDKPANCTPYIQKDWSIYFPNIGGFEAEVVYRPAYNDWELLWASPAPAYTWDCELTWKKQSDSWIIITDLYDDGKIWNKTFALEGNTLKASF